ncbi:YggS family pyridoxal phosphate-dependent enzyme [Xinfangfangia sp. D13-10-4-6]|uniref:YggS family pyridoxal phosphate-dependent enzyme n=1 Tax=Pseudogemmobacter hezensis TaxID=2737662 RepID=UPI0015571A63|nr:YggS family pyridoxal phosphate-dependent enzyme [Pseudogemmobacter hezensis]NPD14258.1 YggS family pyridoxal phosphate-dependent enzyme [Pseudogemmobacter hezensis]
MALAEITARLRAAEKAAGRAEGSVTLIAVSKIQPSPRVEAVLDQGQRVFGENYVQEAAFKWPTWRAKYAGVKLHMIGPLQSNKTKVAVDLFDAIHSVDRPSLAERLANLANARGASPDIFIQINTGEEPQKAGILPQQADDFIAACRAMFLPVVGLMCIPPDEQDPVPHFKMLAQIAARNGVEGLSMGMSSDFELAVAHGATHIRVGSAIFGARNVVART